MFCTPFILLVFLSFSPSLMADDKISSYEDYLKVHLDLVIEDALKGASPYSIKSSPRSFVYSLVDKNIGDHERIEILSSFTTTTLPKTARLFTTVTKESSQWLEVAGVKWLVYHTNRKQLHGAIVTPNSRYTAKRTPEFADDLLIELDSLFVVYTH
jgi:hypothetical protein